MRDDRDGDGLIVSWHIGAEERRHAVGVVRGRRRGREADGKRMGNE